MWTKTVEDLNTHANELYFKNNFYNLKAYSYYTMLGEHVLTKSSDYSCKFCFVLQVKCLLHNVEGWGGGGGLRGRDTFGLKL